MYILITGTSPFYDRYIENMLKRNKECKIQYSPTQWKGVSSEAYELIHKLLEVDPKKRPSAKDALQHSWFKTEKHAELLSVIDKIKKYNNEKIFNVASIKPNFDSGMFTITTPLLCMKQLSNKSNLFCHRAIGSLILSSTDNSSPKSITKRVGSPKFEPRDFRHAMQQEQTAKNGFAFIRKFTTTTGPFKPGKVDVRCLPDMDICGSHGRFVSDLDSMSSKSEVYKTFIEKILNPFDDSKIAYTLMHMQEQVEKEKEKPKMIKQSTMDVIGNSVTIRDILNVPEDGSDQGTPPLSKGLENTNKLNPIMLRDLLKETDHNIFEEMENPFLGKATKTRELLRSFEKCE